MAMGRITGTVLHAERRHGNRKSDGQPFTVNAVRVLVAEQDVTECTIGGGDSPAVALPSRGELVDYIAELGAYNGNAQVRITGHFPREFADAARPAPAKSA